MQAAVVPRSTPGGPTDQSPDAHPVQAAPARVTPVPHEADVDRIVTLYRQAGRALRSGDPSGWGAHLTLPQLRVLYFLGRTGPSSVGEVAAEMGVTQPTATEALEKLVRAGLIERTTDTCDRRVVRNALTPAGRETIDRPWEARRAALASALRCTSHDEREAIAHGLALLCEALERSGQTGSTSLGGSRVADREESEERPAGTPD